MPPLKFQHPDGRTITIDSPDGSIPNEQELDQLFALSNQQGKPETYGHAAMRGFGEGSANLVKGTVEPLARVLYSPFQALERGITGKDQAYNFKLPLWSGQSIDITPNKTVGQAAGTALKASSAFMPGVSSLKLGLSGAMYGGGQSMEEGKPLPTVLKDAAIGGATAFGVGKGMKILGGEKLLTGKTGKEIETFIENPKGYLPDKYSALRDLGGNKRNEIKENFWKNYAEPEYSVYERGIENLAKSESGKLDGAKVIESLESKMVDRGLINPDGTINKAISPADRKFVQGYHELSKAWANSKEGTLSVKDVVNIYKKIKGEYKLKPNTSQRDNISAANDFFDSISDQIDNEGFSAVKNRYRKFKEDQKLIDKKIGLYGSDLETGKGERFLTSGALGESKENRMAAKIIENKTGVNLKGVKAWSGLKRLNPLRYLGKLH